MRLLRSDKFADCLLRFELTCAELLVEVFWWFDETFINAVGETRRRELVTVEAASSQSEAGLVAGNSSSTPPSS